MTKLTHPHFGHLLKTTLAATAASCLLLFVLPANAQAQQFMTQAELLATIPGSQISGVSNKDGKTPWVQAYSKSNSSKKGVVSGIWNKKSKYQMEWYVKGDQWCEKWDSGEGCWSIERVSAKKLRVHKDGKPLKNTWNLK